jgi:dCTP diphosphatase
MRNYIIKILIIEKVIFMEELRKEIVKFQKERDWEQFPSPENLAKSISIEAGELLELFQWDNDFNKDEVADELADVLNYCFLMVYERFECY